MPLVEKYGFHVATCCGYLPQVNDGKEDRVHKDKLGLLLAPRLGRGHLWWQSIHTRLQVMRDAVAQQLE